VYCFSLAAAFFMAASVSFIGISIRRLAGVSERDTNEDTTFIADVNGPYENHREA
jgi:hypothetical protein